jgi:hypothetical protein
LIDAAGYDEGDEYESRRWVLGTERTFEVVEGFPRVPTPVPEGVEKISYTVSLDTCAAYNFEYDVLDIILRGLADG